MQRKKARKAGGWGSEIKGWDTQKGGIDYKGGGDHTPLHTVHDLCAPDFLTLFLYYGFRITASSVMPIKNICHTFHLTEEERR